MDTLHHTPLVASFDALVLGSTLASLALAVKLAEGGERVAIATSHTHLYSDFTRAHRLWITEHDKARLLPSSLLSQLLPTAFDKSFLHPDKLKLHGEQLCLQKNITLFYGAIPVGKDEKTLFFGGKHGVMALGYQRFYDLREPVLPSKLPSHGYVMHVVGLSKHSIQGDYRDPATEVQYSLREGSEPDHALLSVELPPDTPNVDHAIKALALSCFSHLKGQVEGFAQIDAGRFSERPYPLSYSLAEEIQRGVEAQPTSTLAFEQRERIDLPPSLDLHAHNPTFDLHSYARTEAAIPINEIESFDVIVIGGGTSGCMAAIASAREGYHTALVEGASQLGGTSTIGGVSSYWYGRQYKDTALIDGEVDELYLKLGLPREKGPWHRFDYSNPGFKEKTISKLCKELKVSVFTDTTLFATASEGNRIKGVLTGHRKGNTLLLGKQVIDATGDGDVAMFGGASLQYGAKRDGVTLWASLAQYHTPARYRNNFSNTVVLGDPTDFTRFIRGARKLGEDLFDHGTYVAVRESRHIDAVSTITLKDILSFKRPHDTVATFFSNYDPKGKNSADIVYAGFLPPPMSVAIPLSALIPCTKEREVLHGLAVVGKALGATHDAAPGLRMQLDLMHLGFVTGLAAAAAIREKKDFTTVDIKALQQKIIAQTGDSLEVASYKHLDAQELVASFTAEHLKDWTHLPFDQEVGGEPLLLAAIAPSEAMVLPLEQRFALEQDPKIKLDLAHLLLWHKSDKATEFILQTIDNQLKVAKKGTLPRREGSLMCVQLLPDHGVMAESVYLLNLLAWSKRPDIYKPFEEVVERLVNNERDYFDNGASIFNYMESTPYVAERTCIKEFIPLLKRLANLPEFKKIGEPEHPFPILLERQALLLLSIYRALARCGDKEGYRGLVALLGCEVLTISRASLLELQALTEQNIPLDQKRWEAAVEHATFDPKPITERVW